MNNKIGVTIISSNEKKYDHNYIETNNLVGASRIITTFKPKRGYEVVKITIEDVRVLL
jgi:hypothetical protein